MKRKIIILLVILSFNSMFSFDIEEGLIGYYPFNGNANDESGNGNHGTVQGAVLTYDYCGNPNSAYRFDGINDLIDLGNPSIFNFSGSISLCGWAVADSGIVYGAKIISKWKSHSDVGGSWALTRKVFNISSNGSSSSHTNYNQDHYGEWIFVTGVYNIDENKLYYYINCELEDVVDGPGSINLNNSHVYIGAASYFNQLYFKGVLDEIRIYDRVLTEEEICYLYNMHPVDIELDEKTFLCRGDYAELRIENYNPDFDYTWSTGKTDSMIYVSEPGMYYVEAVGENGCYGIDSIEVEFTPESDLDIQGPDVICRGESEYLSIGSLFDNIEWSTGDSTATIVIDRGGWYYVTAYDQYGCKYIDSIEVEEIYTDFYNIIREGKLCEGETVKLYTDKPLDDCIWSTSENTDTIYVNEPGIYFIQNISGKGCISSDTIQLEKYPKEEFNLLLKGKLCEGRTVKIFSDTQVDDYKWSTGETSDTIYVNKSGIYYLETVNEYGCRSVDSINVEFFKTVEVDDKTYICKGNPVELNIHNYSSDYEYTWSTGETSSSIYVDEPGIYYVTAQSPDGCYGVDTVEVEDAPDLDCKIVADNYLCEGSTKVLSTNYNFEVYEWSTGEKWPSIAIDTAGTYFVNVIDEFGCESTDTIIIEEKPLTDFEIEYEGSLCEGETVKLFPNPKVPVYIWSTGSYADTISITKSGTYILDCVNEYGCHSYDTLDIEFFEMNPLRIKQANILCKYSSTILYSLNEFDNYKWSTGETNDSIIIDEPGMYYLEVENLNGCKRIDSIYVDYAPDIDIEISGSPYLCLGDTQTISIGDEYKEVEWSTGETTNYIEIDKGGKYIVNVINKYGCISSDTLIVEDVPYDDFNIETDGNLCEGSFVKLFTNKEFMNYEWSTGETTDSISIEEPGRYFVKCTNEFGCISYDTIDVEYSYIEKFNLLQEGNLCDNYEVKLFTDLNFTDYEWSTGETSDTIIIDKPGTYNVSVVNEFGCVGNKEIYIEPPLNFNLEYENPKFEPVCMYESTLDSLVLFNAETEYTIEISEIYLKNKSEYFKLENSKMPLVILPQEKFYNKVEFFSTINGKLIDTIVVNVEKPCKRQFEFLISAIALPVDANIWVEDSLTVPQYDYCIPIYGNLECDFNSGATIDYQIEISFDSRLFTFEYLETGNIVDKWYEGEIMHLVIEDLDVFLNQETKIINKLCGSVLSSPVKSSIFRFERVQWGSSSIPTYAEEGKLEVNLCEIEHYGLNELKLPEMTILPNPASSSVICKIIYPSDEISNIEIINTQGISVKNVIFAEGDNMMDVLEYNMDVSDLPDGVYIIKYYSPIKSIEEKLLIVK